MLLWVFIAAVIVAYFGFLSRDRRARRRMPVLYFHAGAGAA